LGTVGKNIEDDFVPVYDRATEVALEVTLVDGGQVIVEDDKVELELDDEFCDLVGLTGAYEEARINALQRCKDGAKRLYSRGLRKLRELFSEPLGLLAPLVGSDADHENAAKGVVSVVLDHSTGVGSPKGP
jgi:hypothetical protein